MNELNYLYELGLKNQLILNTEELGTVYVKRDGKECVHTFPYEVYFNTHGSVAKQLLCEFLIFYIPEKKFLSTTSCQTNDKGIRFLVKKIVRDYKIIPGFSLDFETVKSIKLPTN